MARDIYQLKVTIVGTKPPVWRRLLVPGSTSLLSLHGIVQAAFGWEDYHLHEFEINGMHYGTDDGQGFGPRPRSERGARLASVATEGTTFTYLYDFGDGWEHKVLVEKVTPAEPGTTYPACVGGRRACPPEDCGGSWGYQEFLIAIADQQHPEHDAMLDWAGGEFDPSAFDPGDFAQRYRPSGSGR